MNVEQIGTNIGTATYVIKPLACCPCSINYDNVCLPHKNINTFAVVKRCCCKAKKMLAKEIATVEVGTDVATEHGFIVFGCDVGAVDVSCAQHSSLTMTNGFIVRHSE